MSFDVLIKTSLVHRETQQKNVTTKQVLNTLEEEVLAIVLKKIDAARKE